MHMTIKSVEDFTAEEVFEMVLTGQWTCDQFEQWVSARMQEAYCDGSGAADYLGAVSQ